MATASDKERLSAVASTAAFIEYPVIVAATTIELAAFLQFRDLPGGEIEILQLFTSPQFRRQGIARALLRNLLRDVGHRSRPAAIFLEVRESNAAARQLYEGEGFSPVGVRKLYYSGPAEDAIVLSIKLC